MQEDVRDLALILDPLRASPVSNINSTVRLHQKYGRAAGTKAGLIPMDPDAFQRSLRLATHGTQQAVPAEGQSSAATAISRDRPQNSASQQPQIVL